MQLPPTCIKSQAGAAETRLPISDTEQRDSSGEPFWCFYTLLESTARPLSVKRLSFYPLLTHDTSNISKRDGAVATFHKKIFPSSEMCFDILLRFVPLGKYIFKYLSSSGPRLSTGYIYFSFSFFVTDVLLALCIWTLPTSNVNNCYPYFNRK